MKIHKEHVILDQIATMLHSLYSNDPKYRNTVFVLGYNVMAGNSIESLSVQILKDNMFLLIFAKYLGLFLIFLGILLILRGAFIKNG